MVKRHESSSEFSAIAGFVLTADTENQYFDEI